MSKEVRLTIGGTEINLFDIDKLNLSVSRSINEIQSTEKSSASRSKTIVVPGTKHNDIALGFGHEINSTTAISQNLKPDAILEVGGTVLIQGFARSTKHKIDNKRLTHEYHLILIGDNGEWKHSLNGLNVNELDYSEFDHVYDKTSIDESELIDSSGGVLTKPDIVYPLINYGGTLDMVHPSSNNQDLHTVHVRNRFPALQKRSILKKVFGGVGLKIVSSFIDSDFFRRLYMPFTNEQLVNPESFREDMLFAVGPAIYWDNELGGDQSGYGVYFDNGDHYSDTKIYFPALVANHGFKYTYIVPEDSMMNFISNASHYKGYSASGGVFGNWEMIGVFRPDSDPQVEEWFQSSVPDFVGSTAPAKYKIRHETGMQFWEKGTRIFCGISQPETHQFIPETVFYNEVLLGVLEGHTIRMNENLPDMGQIDFIRGLRDEFNLMIVTDLVNKQVFIEPHDDFYTTRAINWTDKLDKARHEEIEDLNADLKKNIKYAFKNDSKDAIVEQIKVDEGIEVASMEVVNSNKFVEGEQTFGNGLFAPTFMDIWPYVGLFTAKVPRLNKDAVNFPSLSVQSTDFIPRSLYYAGVVDLPESEKWSWEGFERTDYPYMYSVDEESVNVNSLYWNNTLYSEGLFQKYHHNRFEIRDKGKLYTAYFNLNDSDMAQLDFRVPIFVVDTYYLLNKVENYDPLADVTTKVELITALNMNIKAIINKLDEPVFPPLPPTESGHGHDLAQTIGATNPTTPVLTLSGNGFGVQSVGNGGESNHPGVTSYGAHTNIGKAEQVAYGNNNQQSNEAQYIVGAGNRTKEKTVMKVSGDGTFKGGNGSNVRTTISGVSHEITYTDFNGEEQVVTMTDEDQLDTHIQTERVNSPTGE